MSPHYHDACCTITPGLCLDLYYLQIKIEAVKKYFTIRDDWAREQSVIIELLVPAHSHLEARLWLGHGQWHI